MNAMDQAGTTMTRFGRQTARRAQAQEWQYEENPAKHGQTAHDLTPTEGARYTESGHKSKMTVRHPQRATQKGNYQERRSRASTEAGSQAASAYRRAAAGPARARGTHGSRARVPRMWAY